MNQVEAFVEIDAPPDIVWDALLTFDSYPEWDPLTRTIEGVAVDATDGPERGDAFAYRPRPVGPTVVAADPPRRLAWHDRLVVPFAYDRYHEFHLEPLENGRRTRLLQRETVRGALAGLAFDEARLERAFVAINEAIATRAERRVSADSSH
ncbi:polyketide cyclase [Natrinema saccharevitans]|uniref:Polyketide cyclase n=1 Tax=Natrinema saccharevitans TaxID=301967 RepID=A0A1S8AV85_9EURY|nr:SRPBCC domain-containing protein [Natrinema saccharevitans]OLZ40507.1 polyketide cyclase [Natrinema saccharevitans]